MSCAPVMSFIVTLLLENLSLVSIYAVNFFFCLIRQKFASVQFLPYHLFGILVLNDPRGLKSNLPFYSENYYKEGYLGLKTSNVEVKFFWSVKSHLRKFPIESESKRVRNNEPLFQFQAQVSHFKFDSKLFCQFSRIFMTA